MSISTRVGSTTKATRRTGENTESRAISPIGAVARLLRSSET